MRIVALLALVTLPVLAGCGTLGNLPAAAEYDPKAAYVVMGVAPRFRIHLLAGKNAGEDEWHLPVLDTPAANVFPDDGFIVLKLPPTRDGESYGISMVLPSGIGGPVLTPCRNSPTPTFAMKTGRVTYVGDVTFQLNGPGRANFSTGDNLEQAKQFLSERYPDLVSHLQHSPFEIRKAASANCDPKTIIIPVYIPSGG